MALSTLRLLSSDLKTDKKWRQYAGAQVKRPLSETFVLIPSGITLKSRERFSDTRNALTCLPHFSILYWQSKQTCNILKQTMHDHSAISC